jgi:hypothetical protein
MTDADGDRWKSLFTLDAQSLVCLLIRFCLHASLISLSLSVCVCVRSISVRFQQHERKCYDRPNFIDRVCLIGRHPFTESCSPTHTHTRHTQTVKVTCVWLLSFDRREKPWKLMWAICKKKTGIESHRSSVDTKFHTSDKQTSYTLCWRANQVLFHGGTDRKTTGLGVRSRLIWYSGWDHNQNFYDLSFSILPSRNHAPPTSMLACRESWLCFLTRHAEEPDEIALPKKKVEFKKCRWIEEPVDR